MAGLELTWAATDLAGRRYLATAGPATGPGATTQFLADLTLTPAGESAGGQRARAGTGPCLLDAARDA